MSSMLMQWLGNGLAPFLRICQGFLSAQPFASAV
jgi:hypothetical protein